MELTFHKKYFSVPGTKKKHSQRPSYLEIGQKIERDLALTKFNSPTYWDRIRASVSKPEVHTSLQIKFYSYIYQKCRNYLFVAAIALNAYKKMRLDGI